MWACRSFVSRARARVPLLTQLRRRVNEPPSVLGGASRRHASDGDRRDDSALVQRGRAQFLYLVLDDMKRGCSVHKVDVAAAAADDGKVVGRLPGPPVFRMQYPNLGYNDSEPYVAVLGSNILAISTGTDNRCCDDAFTVAFDLNTAALTVLHGEPTGMQEYDCYFDLAVAAGNKQLWLFQADGRGMGCLELEHQVLEEDEEDIHIHGDESKPRWRWSYRAVHERLKDGICAHALHPEGRAFFMSSPYVYVYRDADDGHRIWATGTFSYDTERGEWTHHGDWQLPFHGQAHYDGDLGVWIGLHYHSQRDRYDGFDTDGYLCCCDVPPPAPGPLPPWKLSKEKLFVVDLERHIDAKIVPMGGGGGGRFCLVEILTREGVEREGCLGDGDKCLLRITTFRVKHHGHGDGGGELDITDRRPAGDYKLSRYVDMFQVQAFWM